MEDFRCKIPPTQTGKPEQGGNGSREISPGGNYPFQYIAKGVVIQPFLTAGGENLLLL
jgi:hypothetical protein